MTAQEAINNHDVFTSSYVVKKHYSLCKSVTQYIIEILTLKAKQQQIEIALNTKILNHQASSDSIKDANFVIQKYNDEMLSCCNHLENLLKDYTLEYFLNLIPKKGDTK